MQTNTYWKYKWHKNPLRKKFKTSGLFKSHSVWKFDGYIGDKISLCLKHFFFINREWWSNFSTEEWNVRLVPECHLMWTNMNIWSFVFEAEKQVHLNARG